MSAGTTPASAAHAVALTLARTAMTLNPLAFEIAAAAIATLQENAQALLEAEAQREAIEGINGAFAALRENVQVLHDALAAAPEPTPAPAPVTAQEAADDPLHVTVNVQEPACTIHFTHWACGHHHIRPADIPCGSIAQARLVLDAISNAISQPGEARAVLYTAHEGHVVYMAEDHVAQFPEPMYWEPRPVVICCTQEQLDAIMVPALAEARDDIHGGIEALDPISIVNNGFTHITTLTREQVEAALNALGRAEPFSELPPIYADGADALAQLREYVSYIATTEAGPDPYPEDAAPTAGIEPTTTPTPPKE